METHRSLAPALTPSCHIEVLASYTLNTSSLQLPHSPPFSSLLKSLRVSHQVFRTSITQAGSHPADLALLTPQTQPGSPLPAPLLEDLPSGSSTLPPPSTNHSVKKASSRLSALPDSLPQSLRSLAFQFHDGEKAIFIL